MAPRGGQSGPHVLRVRILPPPRAAALGSVMCQLYGMIVRDHPHRCAEYPCCCGGLGRFAFNL